MKKKNKEINDWKEGKKKNHNALIKAQKSTRSDQFPVVDSETFIDFVFVIRTCVCARVCIHIHIHNHLYIYIDIFVNTSTSLLTIVKEQFRCSSCHNGILPIISGLCFSTRPISIRQISNAISNPIPNSATE